MLIWFYWFPLPLGVWEGVRFVLVALPGLFSYLFFGMVSKKRNVNGLCVNGGWGGVGPGG